MFSVLQPWVQELPIRMQSTLALGLRGPDTHACPNIKKITRWLRGLTFVPGNPDNVAEFMESLPPERIVEKGPTAKELEFCSQHFYSHLMHALEVIGYMYPDNTEDEDTISNRALCLYIDMCRLMHLPYEDITDFKNRLRTRNDWPGGKQPVTGREAIALMFSHKE